MAKQGQIKAIKGMKDVLPDETRDWLRVEALCAQLFGNRGYKQIRTPIMESTNLFARSIGAETDIVSKEMYTFEDRNGDSLTLRPEGTASCVRAGIEHGLFYNKQQRLWYVGPMFRHERPQKGRYRQFHQVGVECYGWSTPDIEAEVFSMIKQLFNKLGLQNVVLYINSLGDSDSRARYKAALVLYLQGFIKDLDEDSKRRLNTNPLRILDSKNERVQAILKDAPSILDFLSEDSRARFDELQNYLKALEIEYQVEPRLVRGLDYYNDTVFEWVNHDYGAQATVCGGGRYDLMVEQMGGQATPAFGFGMGLERLIEMLREQNAPNLVEDDRLDAFIVSVGKTSRSQALKIQQNLTQNGLSAALHVGEGSMKNQFKKADKSGASLAIIIGEQESEDYAANVKILRKDLLEANPNFQQTSIAQEEVFNFVTNLLN